MSTAVSESVEVGDDGVARRPGEPPDDRADAYVDGLAADTQRERAAHAARELTERGRDEGDRRIVVRGLPRPQNRMSLGRDRVGDPQARAAGRAAGEGDAPLADPPAQRGAVDTEGRRPAERDPRVGAAVEQTWCDQLEAYEPAPRAS